MPFLGKQQATGFTSTLKQDFTADGSTVAFTLNKPVASPNDLEVFVGNVRQEPTDAYTVSGTTLTMSAAPSSGVNFYVLFKEATQSTTVPAAGTTVPGDFGATGNFSVRGHAIISDPQNNSVTQNNHTSDNFNLHVMDQKQYSAGSNDTYQDDLVNNDIVNAASNVVIEDGQAHLTLLSGTGESTIEFAHGTDGEMRGRIDYFYNDNTMRLSVNGQAQGSESIRISSTGLSFDQGSNYLNDYEEGSWTVEFYDASSAGNTSATTGTGYYTKIGRQVTAIFSIGNIDSTGMTGANNFYFSLPYTSSSDTLYTGSVRLYANVHDSTISLCSQINAGNSRGVLTESRDATTLDNPIWSDFVDDASDISVSITYFV